MTTPDDTTGKRANDMSDVKQLLERVEAAIGPDRALDLTLMGLWSDVAARLTLKEAEAAPAWETPAYTASIDAALALVERTYPDSFGLLQVNSAWDQGTYQNNFGYKLHHSMSSGGSYEQSFAPTAPLAILAALLKALLVRDSTP